MKNENVRFDVLRLGRHTIYLIGEIHPSEKHDKSDREAINQFIQKNGLNNSNTVVTYEGSNPYDSRKFQVSGTIPPSIIGANWRQVPLESFHAQMHPGVFKAIRRWKGWALKTDNENKAALEKVLQANTNYRDFTMAATILQLMKSKEIPSNILLVVGMGHMNAIRRFLTDKKYFRRYRQHLTRLAPVAKKKAAQHLVRTRRRVRRLAQSR